ncbi:MAG: hypothetical protein GEU90_08450 [Gemmatimonas sp.]|nr:hypothetical protein [Gemmatimonas sp.]
MGALVLGSMAAGVAATLAWRYVATTRGPFEPTHFVWSRGLALLCDVNGGVDFVKRQKGARPPLRFDPRAYAGIRDGDLVWVRHIALPQFVAEVLPHVRARFGLVTGDEDWSIPSGFADAERLLESEQVAHWFTQNYDGTDTSGKVSGIPIGLDFHTISNRRKWGHWPATPAKQETELKALRARMPRTRDRNQLVHADFHFNKHSGQQGGGARDEVQEALEDNPAVVFEQRRLKRIELWERKTQYAFVASPRGHGLDCHRTWESLVLGNIPIVKRSPLDPLYEGLPVVIVDDWHAIEEGNLRRWLDTHGDTFDDHNVQERLTNRYWINHMRTRLQAALS